jgi:hypothetical protein
MIREISLFYKSAEVDVGPSYKQEDYTKSLTGIAGAAGSGALMTKYLPMGSDFAKKNPVLRGALYAGGLASGGLAVRAGVDAARSLASSAKETGNKVKSKYKDLRDYQKSQTKSASDMPPFLEQDRPAKVKEIYKALKRDHPGMSAGMKARIANAAATKAASAVSHYPGDNVSASTILGTGVGATAGLGATAFGVDKGLLTPIIEGQLRDRTRVREFNSLRASIESKGVPVLMANPSADEILEILKRDPTVLDNFDIGVEELPELAQVLSDYFKDTTPKYLESPKMILTGGAVNPDFLAHEMGHSEGTWGKRILHALSKGLVPSVGTGMRFGSAALMVSAAGRTPEEQERRFEHSRNFGTVGAALQHVPTLLEEGRASGRAVLAAPKGARLRRLAALTPAFGTYAISALPSAGLPLSAELLRRRAIALQRNADAPLEDEEVIKQAEIEYRGRTFPGYNQPIDSDRPEKKKMVLAKKGDQVKLIHFGQKGYKHNYSDAAKKNYLTRSAGIRGKDGSLTANDKLSANYWARRELWPKNEPADGSAKNREKRASSESAEDKQGVSKKRALGTSLGVLGAATVAGKTLQNAAGRSVVDKLRNSPRDPNEFDTMFKNSPVPASQGAPTKADAEKLMTDNYLLRKIVEGRPPTERAQIADLIAAQLQGRGPHYNPTINKVFMEGIKDPDVLAHELQSSILPARLVGTGLTLGAFGYGAKATMANEQDPEKRWAQARNLGIAGATSMWAPVLLEEARATARAMMAAAPAVRGRRLKTLLPAYGTYAAGAIPSAGVPLAAEILRRRAANKNKTVELPSQDTNDGVTSIPQTGDQDE